MRYIFYLSNFLNFLIFLGILVNIYLLIRKKSEIKRCNQSVHFIKNIPLNILKTFIITVSIFSPVVIWEMIIWKKINNLFSFTIESRTIIHLSIFHLLGIIIIVITFSFFKLWNYFFPPKTSKCSILKSVFLAYLAFIPWNFLSSMIITLISRRSLSDNPQLFIQTLLNENFTQTSKIYLSIIATFIAPFVEEALFRGIIFSYLLKKKPATHAVILTSILFAAVHMESLYFLSLFLLGIVLTWVYIRTSSLLAPILLHMLINLTAIIYVWGGFLL